MDGRDARAPELAARRSGGWWIGLALLVVAIGAVRGRLLDMPLERDEGEYAYAGQLLLDGVPPYAQAYTMKLPGAALLYALAMAAFGETIRGVHLGLLAANAGTSLLVFLLARRLLGAAAGLAAAAAFAVLSLHPAAHGLFANAEHFVLFFAVGGMGLVLKAREERGIGALLGGGLLLGTGVLMKQPGAAFVLAGGLVLLAGELGRRPRAPGRSAARLALFAAACAAPYLATCLALLAAGTFETFWFWTVTYARAYTGELGTDQARAELAAKGGAVLGPAKELALLALLGLSAVVWDPIVRRHGVFLVSFLLLSAAAVAP
ncbi:MAG: glycosyltransferase family 39 protein, partial [Planctomycetota bacterium]